MPNKKEAIKQLWLNCFEDTDPFVRLFFDHVYLDKHAFSLQKEEHTVCSLQVIPYQMQCNGELFKLGYVCGICTQMEFRGQGLASQLIEEVIDKMRDAYDILALIPANADLTTFYRRFGFVDAFGYDTHQVVIAELQHIAEENDISVLAADMFDKERLFYYFNDALRRRSCCMLHGREDFNVICKDIRLEGGSLLYATTADGRLCGMAFTVPHSTNNSVILKEILSDNEAANNALLRASASTFASSTLTYRTIGTTNYYGMLRLLNPDIPLSVKDTFISLMLD